MPSRSNTQREKPRRAPADTPAPQPSAAEDLVLPVVIAACFIPIGLLVIAASGGGLPLVVIAFIAAAVLTAALTTLVVRASKDADVDGP